MNLIHTAQAHKMLVLSLVGVVILVWAWLKLCQKLRTLLTSMQNFVKLYFAKVELHTFNGNYLKFNIIFMEYYAK